jgi:hypothetical protein
MNIISKNQRGESAAQKIKDAHLRVDVTSAAETHAHLRVDVTSAAENDAHLRVDVNSAPLLGYPLRGLALRRSVDTRKMTRTCAWTSIPH